MRANPEHLTANCYVDQAISNSLVGPTLVENNQKIDFNSFKLSNKNSISLNVQAVNDNQIVIKSYADQFHQES